MIVLSAMNLEKSNSGYWLKISIEIDEVWSNVRFFEFKCKTLPKADIAWEMRHRLYSAAPPGGSKRCKLRQRVLKMGKQAWRSSSLTVVTFILNSVKEIDNSAKGYQPMARVGQHIRHPELDPDTSRFLPHCSVWREYLRQILWFGGSSG